MLAVGAGPVVTVMDEVTVVFCGSAFATVKLTAGLVAMMVLRALR